MKKYIHIVCSVLLAVNIVLAYTGVTVYKMVCAAENGKTVFSVVDVKSGCSHAEEELDDCCRPVSRLPEKKDKKDCCDYSQLFQKIDDETLVQQQQCATNHILPEMILGYGVIPFIHILACEKSASVTGPPPLLALRKQSVQSQIQVFII